MVNKYLLLISTGTAWTEISEVILIISLSQMHNGMLLFLSIASFAYFIHNAIGAAMYIRHMEISQANANTTTIGWK